MDCTMGLLKDSSKKEQITNTRQNYFQESFSTVVFHEAFSFSKCGNGG